MDCLIVDKLKKIRKNKKITQEQLAEKLDISRSKVSSWETNRRDMNIFEAIKLANIYEVSLDNLFEINKITEEEFVKIADKFLKDKNITLGKKVKIIESIREGLKKNNVDEFYESYKKIQNATK